MHFDNTSIKILTGIIVGVLIFAYLVTLFNSSFDANIGDVDTDYREDPEGATDPDDLKEVEGDEEGGWWDWITEPVTDYVYGPVMQFFTWVKNGIIWTWEIGSQATGAIRQLNNLLGDFPLGDVLLLLLSIPLAIVIIRVLGVFA